MKNHLIYLIKNYFLTYRGLSTLCYYGFIFSLFESILIGIYYYLPIYFIDFVHLDLTNSGLIISCYGIGAILGGFAGGKLSDAWSPGIVSAICLLIQGVVYLVFLKIQAIIFLMINVFVLGMVSYGFITANHLFTLSYCSESDNERLKVINILSMTSNLGLGLSAIIMGKIYKIGFHYIFLSAGIILFILASVSFIFSSTSNSLKNISEINKKITNETIKLSTHKVNHQIAVLVLSSVFFIGLIISQLSTTYSTYIREIYPEQGIKTITILFALNSFMVVLFGVHLGDFIKKFNKIMMVGIGGFFIGCGMFILIFASSFIVVVLACVVYTLGEIIFFNMAQYICYQNSVHNKRGTSLGFYRMVYASSRVIGPAIGTAAYAKCGGEFIWIVSGIIGISCLISANYFKKFN